MDVITVFISNNVEGVANYLMMPLAMIFFIVIIAAFVGYFAMKKSIYGSLIFMLMAMVFSLLLLPAFLLLFL